MENRKRRIMNGESFRGIAIGLWILTGFAYFVRALFPRSTGGDLLGPLFLTAAVLWMALQKPMTSSLSPERPVPRLHWALLLTVVITGGIALTIIREGDQRSFLFVGLTAVLAVLLARAVR